MIAHKTIHVCLQRAYSAQATLPVPVIKIPKYVTQYVAKAKKRGIIKDFSNLNRKITAYRGDTSQPVITSTNGDYNHYLGQTYHENYNLPIQSKFWFKEKSAGQKFTIQPIESNPSLPSNDPNEYIDDEYFPNEFEKLNLNENIVNSLKNEFKFEKPTRIQTLAVPRILSGNNMLIATEAGSGKTISYLAPILHNISKLKKITNVNYDTPMALVLVPGRELAEQIGEVAYRLAQGSNIDVKVLISRGTKQTHLKVYKNSSIDLLVASIGCFKRLFDAGEFKVSNLHHVVLDEADTLVDGSFIEDTNFLLQRMMIKTQYTPSHGTQLILASSIYPSGLPSILCDSFHEESFTKVCSPYLHRVPLHIPQKFCRVNRGNRAGEVLQLVKSDYSKKKPVMVFCNKAPACEWLSHFLTDNGVPNGCFHGSIGPNIRMDVLRQFQEGLLNVLVCTDLASRGLDTQWVKHVINFDFPNSVSDYLLRIGRVRRVGTNHGHVTNLIVEKSTVYTVHEVETAVRSCKRIASVDSNTKDKIRKLFYREYMNPNNMPC